MFLVSFGVGFNRVEMKVPTGKEYKSLFGVRRGVRIGVKMQEILTE